MSTGVRQQHLWGRRFLGHVVEQIAEVPAVHLPWDGHAGLSAERRDEVGGVHRARSDYAGRQRARAAHDERRGDSGVVWREFQGQAMLSKGEPLVAGEHHERVGTLARLIQSREEASHAFVDRERAFVHLSNPCGMVAAREIGIEMGDCHAAGSKRTSSSRSRNVLDPRALMRSCVAKNESTSGMRM